MDLLNHSSSETCAGFVVSYLQSMLDLTSSNSKTFFKDFWQMHKVVTKEIWDWASISASLVCVVGIKSTLSVTHESRSVNIHHSIHRDFSSMQKSLRKSWSVTQWLILRKTVMKYLLRRSCNQRDISPLLGNGDTMKQMQLALWSVFMQPENSITSFT